MPIERSDKIAGLRALADFLEAHPAVPVPKFEAVIVTEPDALAEFLDGDCPLELAAGDHYRRSPDHAWLVRRFGPLPLEALTHARLVLAAPPMPVPQPELVLLSRDAIARRIADAKAEAAARAERLAGVPVSGGIAGT